MIKLSSIQQKTLDEFARSSLVNQFYWTGGTALAMVYLQHRQSYDLDFFSDDAFSVEAVNTFIQGLQKSVSLDYVEARKIFDRREFFLHNNEELRLEFVYYEHPRVGERKERNGISVDSFEDIATNKTMAFLTAANQKIL